MKELKDRSDHALRIVGWDELYEVNDKNRRWKEGDAKRSGPLPYIRLRVWGSTWTKRWRRLVNGVPGESRKMRELPAAYFGVFVKLLELAAANKAEFRGWVVDSDGERMGIPEIADVTGLHIKTLQTAIVRLTAADIGWIEWKKMPATFPVSRKKREVPGSAVTETYTDTESNSDPDTHTPEEAGGERVSVRWDVVDAWNEIAGGVGLPKVRATRDKANPKSPRWKKLATRMGESEFADNFREIFKKVAASPFCRGEGPSGWRASFGWLVANAENYVKVLEGNYRESKCARRGDGTYTPAPGDTSQYKDIGEKY